MMTLGIGDFLKTLFNEGRRIATSMKTIIKESFGLGLGFLFRVRVLGQSKKVIICRDRKLAYFSVNSGKNELRRNKKCDSKRYPFIPAHRWPIKSKMGSKNNLIHLDSTNSKVSHINQTNHTNHTNQTNQTKHIIHTKHTIIQ